jgi:hypothetical protein
MADECMTPHAWRNPLGAFQVSAPAPSPSELAPLFDAALPKDAPGAWIREALERMFTPGAPTDGAVHRVESVSDGRGSYRWECDCGALGPKMRSFAATDAAALAHTIEARGDVS